MVTLDTDRHALIHHFAIGFAHLAWIDPVTSSAGEQETITKAAAIKTAKRLMNSSRQLQHVPAPACHSIERDADSLLLPPNNMARQMQPLGIKHQGEMLRHSSGAGYVERRPGFRHIADHASDRATSSGSSGFTSLSRACPCGSVALARTIHDLLMAELSRDGSSDDRSRQSWTAALASWMFSRTPRSLWNRRQRPVSNNSVRYSSRCSARAHQRAEISRLRAAST